MVKIGMIGGSGFDDPDFLKDVKAVKRGTPFGSLSHDLIIGKAGDIEVVIMLRHGKGHRILPSAINFRANIWAMKEIGVTHIIATSACGSLREEIEPGHLVFPDQFIDRTRSRKSTFHEGDQVVHISMADPFCEKLRRDSYRNGRGPGDSPPPHRDGGYHRGAEVFHTSGKQDVPNVGWRYHQHVYSSRSGTGSGSRNLLCSGSHEHRL